MPNHFNQLMHNQPPTPGNSSPVVSAQTAPHEHLLAQIAKYSRSDWAKPITDYNRAAFDRAQDWLLQRKGGLILDSGCGTGDSSRALAQMFPEHQIIGVDRSEHRLSRQREHTPDNCLLLRADLLDFWRLANQAGWRPERHYLLYPNPEPKPKHLMRRFHAHPIFPVLLALGGEFECRSNWPIYLEEMALSLNFHNKKSTIQRLQNDSQSLTPFEHKYRSSGQCLWQLRASL